MSKTTKSSKTLKPWKQYITDKEKKWAKLLQRSPCLKISKILKIKKIILINAYS